MKYFYRRKLPHIIVDNYAYFVTARLAGSLPQEIIVNLKRSYQKRLKDISSIVNIKTKREEYNLLKWNYFVEFDALLDKYKNSPHWLADNKIAELLKDSLHFRDGKDYDLIAYTIMSNHIHLAFIPYLKKISRGSEFKRMYPLGGLLGSLKRYTAKEANKLLNRSGDFWQHESYDHIIRNNEELYMIIEYILNNPVNAGVVSSAEEYKWNYCKYF
jgi:REP element-mobilizing transposase RayT